MYSLFNILIYFRCSTNITAVSITIIPLFIELIYFFLSFSEFIIIILQNIHIYHTCGPSKLVLYKLSTKCKDSVVSTSSAGKVDIFLKVKVKGVSDGEKLIFYLN